MRIAILVDGGFYRKRAETKLGPKKPSERAKELNDYCYRHLVKFYDKSKDNDENKPDLYRIFYYDCPPIDKKVYHPYLKTQIDLSKTDLYIWMTSFLNELKRMRKFALRLGKLADSQAHYTLRYETLRKLCDKTISFNDLKEEDFELSIDQKGVDMKIGIDIASLAYKKQVDRIVLIAGDSDFVPAAKLARREGIDFILDPLFAPIKPDLFEHIDGLYTCDSSFRDVKTK